VLANQNKSPHNYISKIKIKKNQRKIIYAKRLRNAVFTLHQKSERKYQTFLCLTNKNSNHEI